MGAVAGLHADRLPGHLGARSVAQRQLRAAHARRGLDVDMQLGVLIGRVQLGNDAHILQVRLLPGRERHAPGDARQTPEILVLEIGAVRPAEHLQGDEVLTRLDELRHIELRSQLAVLAVADEAAVDPYVDIRGGRTDRQENVLSRPLLRHLERTAVGADMILGIGHLGRVVREIAAPGIAHIHVDRVAVAVQLPHARHGHAAPGGIVVVGAEEVLRAFRGVARPVETPHPVERKPLARIERRVHGQAVDFIHGRILPFAARLSRGDGRTADRRKKHKGSFHRYRIGIHRFPSSCETSTSDISHRPQSNSSR